MLLERIQPGGEAAHQALAQRANLLVRPQTFGRRVACLAQRCDEMRGAVMESRVCKLQRLPPRQRLELLRKITRLRHAGAADQHWDDSDAPLECRTQLPANEVFRIVQTAVAQGIDTAEPGAANDDDDGRTRGEPTVDHVDEVFSQLDGVDVHEHLIRSKLRHETVVESPRVRRGVLTSVIDEDLAHDPRLPHFGNRGNASISRV